MDTCSLRNSRFRKLIFLAIANCLLVSCGGGGGGSDFDAADFLGGWTGSVALSSNSCPRDIPEEFTSIAFSHVITEELNSPAQLTLTLADSGALCRDIRVPVDAETFNAVCPERPLPGFLEGLACGEEIVWNYEPEGSGRASVLRTSYVRCSKDGLPELACIVEYRGEAGSCLRGICPQP